MRQHFSLLIRKSFTLHLVLSITLLLSFSIKPSAQGFIYTESFPNTFNTGFTTPIPATTYTGSSGNWTFSSNDVASVVCNGAFYQSAPNAMKLVNYNNATAPASTSRAVSPAYNMSAWGCSNKVDVFFRLFTYTLNGANSCYTFYVDFSADGGTTWATFYQKTAAQLIATFGGNTWNDIWLSIPASYRTANFKVRFRGVQSNGCAYDSYVYIDDVKMYAEACPPPCTGEVTNLYFNKLDGGTDLPISNGSTFTVAQLGSLYNLEAGTTGTIGSVKYTITGPTPSSNIENTTPYNSPATGGGAWTGAVGTYNVNLKTYSGADGTGTLCHDTTITFNLSNTTYNCSCPGTNVVLNPSFENGITSWSFSGGSLAAGTGAVACGNYSGDLNNTSASSKAWQTIGTDLAIGTAINVSVYAGTHDNTFNNYVAIEFLDAANVVLGSSVYTQVDKVLGSAPVGPQLYTLSATVPSGAKYTRVAFGGTGTYTKTDQWCASLTPPVNNGSIGDRVWLDADGDGIQDASETSGITGVTVQLKNSAGTVIATTTTNATGNYLFSGLAAGNYTVVFPVSISGAVVTLQNVGGDDNIDSDPSQTTGATGVIALTAGQNITNIDAGYCPTTLQIGNRVWNDVNNNGIDNTEAGIASVTVNLYKDNNNDNIADGAAIATTTTNATGNYSFSNQAPGNYIVGVIIPAGFTSSTINGGDPDNNINADDNGVLFVSNEIRGQAITLVAGTEPDGTNTNTNNNVTYDFGFYQTTPPPTNCSTISTTSGGSKVEFLGVTYAGSGTSITSTFTYKVTSGCSPNISHFDFGYFNCQSCFDDPSDFVAVTGAPYVITTDEHTGICGIKYDFGVTCGASTTVSFTLKGNYGVGNIEFGLKASQNIEYATICGPVCTPPVTLNIGNTVWYDVNNNGTQDAAEPGIPGVVVKLYDCAGTYLNKTVTTDADGNYLFTGLATGSYIVGITTPAGYTKSDAGTTNVGADNQNDGVNVVTTEIRTNCFATTASTNNIDFGLKGTGSIGDFVWNDLNANGLQDAGEPGIQGVVVMLTHPGGATSTATTDINGAYSFNNLAPGTTYSVSFATPSGYVVSPSNVGGNDNIDSDPVGGVVTNVTVVAGTANNTIDAGFYQLGSIGDRIWRDDNGNGIQDAGEVGLSGVTVTLLNAAGQVIATTTTTDALGNYKFSNLPPGNYSLRVTPPANYSLSDKTQGGNTTLDSDFDPTTYTTGTVTLVAGQNRTDIDAGLKFTQTIGTSVGDRVWLDTNSDGIQDAGEPGVSNVLVTLYNSVGIPVASTYTDANGNYLFTGVAPGTYTVGVSLPPAFVFSPNNGALSVANNSDINPANGRTASFTVNAGDQITYVDAGLRNQQTANGSVGDYVWNDLNKDGVQDAGEPGIAGVTVRLVNAITNTVVATTITDATGKYIFNDVVPGTYQVDFVTPAGYTTTTRLNTNPVASVTDSDVNPATSRTGSFSLAAGQRISSVDAGYWITTPPGTAKLGDRVWLDGNQNGIQDAGEPGVGGITVTLYDAGNIAIKQAVTDQNGLYIFTDLAAGNYTVGFTNLPAGFTFTTQGTGTVATGSDANPVTGKTATIALAAGQTNLDVDAGIRSTMAGTASIGNKVWYDLNNNGLQDAGELGIQGITVELLDAAGNPIDKDPSTPGIQPTITITNASGEYLFTNLPAGDYRVRFSTLPAGYNAATKGAGTDRNVDSDGNPIVAGTSTTDVISVAAGDERLDIDLGLFSPTAPLGQLGDRVFFDANNNGIQDAAEQGVPGVSVALLDATGNVIRTTVTDGEGIYKFVNLSDATYSVQFSNLPAGFTFSAKDQGANDAVDSDADPITGKTGTYVISGGNSNMTVDAGIYSTKAALGDYVWLDTDKDGIQDANESAVAGITVTLYDASNNAVASAITDQSGKYFFSNLNPGTYTVGFTTIPAQLVFTAQDVVAAGDAADSDVNPATGKTGTVTLAAGQVNRTVDAGLKPYVPASIGDFVWYDLDRDGIQDAGEPGVAGIVVTLYNAANQPIGSAITDGNGFYTINNVPPGTGYYVQFSNKPNVTDTWTLQNVGGAGAINNSKVNATGQTAPFNVAEGQNISNIDAGLIKQINVSGNVWHDVNGMSDGFVNNSGALTTPPSQQIPANLFAFLVDDATGLVVAAEGVDPLTGKFIFENVAPNKEYYVVISRFYVDPGFPPPVSSLPAGWQNTGQNLGLDPGNDGLNDAKLFITVETSDVINVNFGIRLAGRDIVIG